MRLATMMLLTCALAACGAKTSTDDAGSNGGGSAHGGGSGGSGGSGGNAGSGGSGGSDAGGLLTCMPCIETAECGANAACVQYAGNDYCGKICASNGQCAIDEQCLDTAEEDGTRLQTCVPTNGTCGTSGCGVCDPGLVCDRVAGECVSPDDDGGEPDDWDAGVDDFDSGTPDAGRRDAGTPVVVGIGPDGGRVPRFVFAVLGDTRPPASNDTAHYPTARVNKIYDTIQGLNPRPQFVVATGDYMFANANQNEGKPQMDLYVAATKRYSGPVFASMGNHECAGGLAANCAGVTTNKNFNAYLNGLVKPLGKTVPYYEVPFSDTNGKWTAKLLVVACNAWGTNQKNWLTAALARRTDYTFIARHEPRGSTAPCNNDMDAMLSASGTRYTMLLVGHVHQYNHSGKQLVEGVGGAPLTGNDNFGFATITQRLDGGVTVRQYDSTTGGVVSTYSLPPN
ncbi:MAG: metallophosphoesterase [Archangiaceae bacterium]|nr:metallophosphoesterase [Archangiaceae bacterium]